MLLYMLGKSHSHKGIRPWQYAVFVQTLLNTIASRLGSEASSNVMESWVHQFAYVMKYMLPHAIKGQVVCTEVHVNTSSEFASGKIAQEVEEIEEMKSLKAAFEKNSNLSRKSGTGVSRKFSTGGGSLSARERAASFRERAASSSHHLTALDEQIVEV